MPASNAYQTRITFQANDQEDGQPTFPVFRDNWTETGRLSRQGANNGGGNPGTIEVSSTVETIIAFTGLTRPHIVFLKNLDGANVVRYGPESAGSMVVLGELQPNDQDKIALAQGVILRAQFTNAPGRLQVRAYEW